MLPFDLVRGWLDAKAGDGSAEPYTRQLHLRLQVICIVASLFQLLSGYLVWWWIKRNRDRWETIKRQSIGECSLLWAKTYRSIESSWPIILLLIAIGTATRAPFLSQPLRFDEAYTYLEYASQPLPVTCSKYTDPNNHLLHSLLVHGSAKLFGNGEWALRLPAMIAGLLTIPVIFLIGDIRFGPIVGLLAALQVATSSILIEYSVLARGYSLICLLTLMSICLTLVIANHSSIRIVAPIGLVGLSVAGFWTVPTYLFSFAVVLAFWSIVRRSSGWSWYRTLREVILIASFTGVGTIMVYLPVIIVSGWRSIVANPYVISKTFGGFFGDLPRWLPEVHRLLMRDVPIPSEVLLALGLIFSLTIALPKGTPVAKFVLLIVLPIPLLLLVQRVTPFARIFIFLLPPLMLVSAAGWGTVLSKLRDRRLKDTAAALLILVMTIWPMVRMVQRDSIRRSDEGGRCVVARTIARDLATILTHNDYLLVSSPCSSPLIYYGDQVGIDRSHYDPPKKPTDRSIRLIAIVSSKGEPLPELIASLSVEAIVAKRSWKVLLEYPQVTVFQTTIDR